MRGSWGELSRRDMLKLSAAGVLGTSVSGWFNILASDAAAAARQGVKHKSCILLWMYGGPSQQHTFDMKEGGQFKAIPTSVTGIRISEYLPKLAKQMHHMAVLRSMSTGESSHERARYLMHTGVRRGQGGVIYPSMGAIASAELGQPDSALPNFVSIGRNNYGSGYLGPRHAPLIVSDPLNGVPDLKPAGNSDNSGTEQADLQARMRLLDKMDSELLSKYDTLSIETHQKGYQRAIQLMQSAKAKAFDLSAEPSSIRQAYGQRGFGASCLLARRLIEAGVAFVEVSLSNWDTHRGAAEPVKKLSESLDPAMSTLITDLKDRGLLDSTLIIWMGEFGRSPRDGQNHWPRAWTTVLAGGGLKTGQAIGRTDKVGGTVADRPISAPDFLATIYKALGIDYDKQNTSKNGRTFRIVDKGAKPINELF